MDERLKKQLEFALEIDKVKNVFRQTSLSGHGRKENDAEHSWHMAVMAYFLREYANEKVDIFIGNHVWNNDTKGKYERMMAGEKNPFIDAEEWVKFLDRCRENLLTQLKKEEESNK